MLVPQKENKDLITPRVIITFDDGGESDYNLAYPIMSLNLQKGVSFINSTNIGTAGKMTLSQLTEMKNFGWDISNHGAEHLDLTTLSETDMNADIDDCNIYLINNNLTPYFMSYPFGKYNQSIINFLISRGYKLVRSSIEGQYNNQLELSGNNQYLIQSRYIANTTAVATVEGYIDDVIAAGGLCILMFHAIVNAGAGEYEYLTADFQTISDYLKTKEDAKLLKVVTMSEYYEDYLVGEKGAGTSMIRGLSHG
jgi:peptidoglycan/xylan/chitin deacetylase (PgdA/CDA1 family)